MQTLNEHAVVIAGAGPTGLMLAGELALAGVDVAVIERRAGQEVSGSRAGGLHSRTIEVLDQRGIADRFLAQGQTSQSVWFAGITLDISDFPTRHNYVLGLWQEHIERILAGWVDEFGVPIYREREVIGFAQNDAGVDVELSDGRTLRAQYLVGCDGGRSLVRKAAGIEFPGLDPTTSNLIAEVEMTEEPECGIRRDALGIHSISSLGDGKPMRVLVTERHVGTATEPTLRDLSEALIAVYGTDYGVHSPTSISRFTDMTRQAAAYRNGRVFLAGDAAHVHPPDGGQGLQTGVQDAVNLGWKLAQVVRQTSPDSLLDTYHAERHPVGARVLRNTMAAIVLRREDERTKALRDTISELLSLDEPRKRSPRTCPVSTFTTISAMATRCSDGACPISIWSPPTARSESSAAARRPVRCCSISVNPTASTSTRWADRVEVGRRRIQWRVGATRARRGHRSHRRVDSARWIRRVGGRPNAVRPRRRANDLVWAAYSLTITNA